MDYLYFSATLFNKYYKLLGTNDEGKLNLERTSSLAYFLALDQMQKDEEEPNAVINMYKDSLSRKNFMEKVGEIFVIAKNGSFEYQANILGCINKVEGGGNSMSSKTGKNFLSTQVISASSSPNPVGYPKRPAASFILELGFEIEGHKHGIKKSDSWKNNLMKFIEFRKCGTDTFPLIVFLLRDKQLNNNLDFNNAIREGLGSAYTQAVVDYLIVNAQVPSLVWDDLQNFATAPFTIDELDTELFMQDQPETNNLQPTVQVKEFKEIEIPNDISRNRIVYGAPGTGKSYKLNKDAKEFFPDDDLYIRVTLYPNYSYSQFVGTYKPTPIYKDVEGEFYKSDMVTSIGHGKEPLIDYTFVPGPFLIQLVNALKYPKSNFVIIIEEINRANAAAVFGDVFQLLDRKDDGESEYTITFNADVTNYLRKEGIFDLQIKIPKNLYIWATMNSADQGVTPLDTAFKRRWSFEYMPIDAGEGAVSSLEMELKFLENPILWNKFRKILNQKLKELMVPEDKLIGPFFMKSYELSNPESFKNKLLLYLRDDVLRHNATKFFKHQTFSDIVTAYDQGGNIFRTISKEELVRSE
ncbi:MULTISPECIES: AAA family ATPase [Bacillus]|uniref:AAA family ATPase n=1 Tax=Bacillus TaxID=1386 RepID=UPI0001A04895|nr:Type II restriction-modification system restriction subunit [Bacillus cereus BDRD-Cer4]